jgi:hypothetical protein
MADLNLPDGWNTDCCDLTRELSPRQRVALRQVVDVASSRCADRSESLDYRRNLFAACASVAALLEGREEPDADLCEERACEFVT